MEIHSRFSTGDVVYAGYVRELPTRVTCSFCEGNGRLDGRDGRSTTCPTCWGKGTTYGPKEYQPVITGPLTIGQVRVTVIDTPGAPSIINADNFKPRCETQEEYMAVETGIGSGRLYPGEQLYPTRQEATDACQAECDEKNTSARPTPRSAGCVEGEAKALAQQQGGG